MKRVLGVAVVALALGIWGGVHAWQSASVAVNIQTALAIVFGLNLALCLWVWYRAPLGSGDARAMPVLSVLMVAMLVGLLPRLFWPAAERLHIAGSIASMIVTTGVLVMQIRRRRSLRRGARPV